jgi:5,10-methylene-tetrahydrofolate dehydrogenase/methenyl tetrahydrofolate cyclohydrolase
MVGDNQVGYRRPGKTKASRNWAARDHLPGHLAGDLLDLVADLNADDRWHGILVQMPPPWISESIVASAVAVAGRRWPAPGQRRRLFRGTAATPCTPHGRDADVGAER